MGDTMTVTEEHLISDGVGAMNDEAHELAEKARRHLWMHFSRMGSYSETQEIPIMVRGEGCYVWDIRGKKYMDGLAGLFTSQLGHGRADLAQAAATQAETLEYFPVWTYAHPPAINLAAKIASLTPGDLNRVFFTGSGGEAVESAWKLAKQYHRARGDYDRYKVISRAIAYHGTTMGALSITTIPGMRTPFEPLVPGAIKVPNTNFYRAEEHSDDINDFSQWAADEIERAILREDPETVAAVFVEPVQNSGGCITPPPEYLKKVREICTKYGVLMVSDEVICAFGRLGEWFGATKFDYVPDIITCAKGLTSGYSPLGAMIVRDEIMKPFLEADASFLHGFTFAGHPVSCAVALKNIEIFENEDILGHVRRTAPIFKEALNSLKDIPIVGDVRGEGFFYGIELVSDQATKGSFTPEQEENLLRGYLSGALYENGLICRADDRGDPVIALSPPLISGEKEIDFIVSTLRKVLEPALDKI
jgi:adenosylmethionine-8-amino-7-oxononanoate aminotransferase